MWFYKFVKWIYLDRLYVIYMHLKLIMSIQMFKLCERAWQCNTKSHISYSYGNLKILLVNKCDSFL